MEKKKTYLFLVMMFVLIIGFVLVNQSSLIGNVIFQDEQKIKLGYCQTMESEAIELAKDNDYELVKHGSASEVLFALSNEEIDKGLIGRKAKLNEISKNIKETTLKSGHILVTNKKGFLEYSELPYLEIHTYLTPKEVNTLTPDNKNIFYYEFKQEAINKISEEKAVLIPWDDWRDDFELLVVMDGNKKVKDFRGVFLYEN